MASGNALQKFQKFDFRFRHHSYSLTVTFFLNLPPLPSEVSTVKGIPRSMRSVLGSPEVKSDFSEVEAVGFSPIGSPPFAAPHAKVSFGTDVSPVRRSRILTSKLASNAHTLSHLEWVQACRGAYATPRR